SRPKWVPVFEIGMSYPGIAFAQNPIHNLESLVRSDSNVSSSIQSFVAFDGGYTMIKDLSAPKSNPSLVLYVGANSRTLPAQALKYTE
ncbi:MAG: hypothetical protein ACRECH_03525, partial [Nitrososphaerales archaeon]